MTMNITKYFEIRRHYLEVKEQFEREASQRKLHPEELNILLYLGENSAYAPKDTNVIKKVKTDEERNLVKKGSIGNIVHTIGLTPSTTSTHTSSLWKKKLVKKGINPENERHRWVGLTPKGIELYNQIKKDLENN